MRIRSRIRNLFDPGSGMEKIRIREPELTSRIRNTATYIYSPPPPLPANWLDGSSYILIYIAVIHIDLSTTKS
jgi:hypothetical protein